MRDIELFFTQAWALVLLTGCALAGFDPGNCPGGSGGSFWATENATNPMQFMALGAPLAAMLLVVLRHHARKWRLAAVGMSLAAGLVVGVFAAAGPSYEPMFVPVLGVWVTILAVGVLPFCLIQLAADFDRSALSGARQFVLLLLILLGCGASYWTVSSRIAFGEWNQHCMDWNDPLQRAGFEDRMTAAAELTF